MRGKSFVKIKYNKNISISDNGRKKFSVSDLHTKQTSSFRFSVKESLIDIFISHLLTLLVQKCKSHTRETRVKTENNDGKICACKIFCIL